MPNYRRAFVAGGTFFFTLVTARRAAILCTPIARAILRQSITEARARRPFAIDAFVLLPDHLHAIWTLPHGDHDFSTRWADVKANFTRRWLKNDCPESSVTKNQKRQGRRGVWQPRFIEHTIRDDDDMELHMDYVHFNPVKHGLVQRPVDWPWSSLHRYIKMGWYTADWGCSGTGGEQRVNADLLE